MEAARLGAEARAALRALAERGLTLATAESLTGGMIGAAVTSVAGASAVYRGGVVAYATGVKAGLLGVDPGLLARHGAVHPGVAAAMAEGARSALAADTGLAVTGVAGPDPQDGMPVGRVYIAVAGPGGRAAGLRLDLGGDRARIRFHTALSALSLLTSTITGEPGK
ncbi:nicotinamide-nucleotide amidohydrolase family protein [Nocardiopsis sp. CNT-189]|uniref:CinA family protein n=1 Tax=Nocardiopsis oceanisediminis TaxID=2816862 RepID=UPI003B2CD4E2